MKNNKTHEFKVGDRVKTEVLLNGITKTLDGVIYHHDKDTNEYYVVFFNDEKKGVYYANELTPIDSDTRNDAGTIQESPDVSGDDMKTRMKKDHATFVGMEKDLAKPDIIRMFTETETIFVVDGDGKATCYNEDETLVRLASLYNQQYYNQGFNPETLEFDGVKILEGDNITFSDSTERYEVFDDSGVLSIDLNQHRDDWQDRHMPIRCFNITNHFPAKNKELERLEEIELEISATRLTILKSKDQVEIYELLDRYHELMKAKEDYKANNN